MTAETARTERASKAAAKKPEVVRARKEIKEDNPNLNYRRGAKANN